MSSVTSLQKRNLMFTFTIVGACMLFISQWFTCIKINAIPNSILRSSVGIFVAVFKRSNSLPQLVPVRSLKFTPNNRRFSSKRRCNHLLHLVGNWSPNIMLSIGSRAFRWKICSYNLSTTHTSSYQIPSVTSSFHALDKNTV